MGHGARSSFGLNRLHSWRAQSWHTHRWPQPPKTTLAGPLLAHAHGAAAARERLPLHRLEVAHLQALHERVDPLAFEGGGRALHPRDGAQLLGGTGFSSPLSTSVDSTTVTRVGSAARVTTPSANSAASYRRAAPTLRASSWLTLARLFATFSSMLGALLGRMLGRSLGAGTSSSARRPSSSTSASVASKSECPLLRAITSVTRSCTCRTYSGSVASRRCRRMVRMALSGLASHASYHVSASASVSHGNCAMICAMPSHRSRCWSAAS